MIESQPEAQTREIHRCNRRQGVTLTITEVKPSVASIFWTTTCEVRASAIVGLDKLNRRVTFCFRTQAELGVHSCPASLYAIRSARGSRAQLGSISPRVQPTSMKEGYEIIGSKPASSLRASGRVRDQAGAGDPCCTKAFNASGIPNHFSG